MAGGGVVVGWEMVEVVEEEDCTIWSCRFRDFQKLVIDKMAEGVRNHVKRGSLVNRYEVGWVMEMWVHTQVSFILNYLIYSCTDLASTPHVLSPSVWWTFINNGLCIAWIVSYK